MNIIKAKCKNCGCEAPTDQFKLHFEMRQMVCPTCFSGRNKQKEQQEQEKISQPPGWDAEDVYLETVRKQKKIEEKGKVTRIPGTDQVKYSCNNCQFVFKYDPFKKRPSSCPYCNSKVPKIKTFGML